MVDAGIPAGEGIFVQPTLAYRETIAGEPPGATDRQECTWSAIAACTGPGRKFADYASCDTVPAPR